MGSNLSIDCFHCTRTKQSSLVLTESGIPEFTDEEKQLINRTWNMLEGKSAELGVDIFLRIFVIRPDVKKFFPFSTAVGDALLNHPYFKGHSMRFINAIKMTVTNLDALEVIHIPNLRQLGRYHTKIPEFTHDIFEIFYLAMDYVWTKHLRRMYNKKTRRVWEKVFRFLISQVESGYQEGLKDNEAEKTAQAVQQKTNHINDSAKEGAIGDVCTRINTNSTESKCHQNGSTVDGNPSDENTPMGS